jgi:hypothetical protein
MRVRPTFSVTVYRSLLPPCGFDRLVLRRKTTHYGIDILRLSRSHRACSLGCLIREVTDVPGERDHGTRR